MVQTEQRREPKPAAPASAAVRDRHISVGWWSVAVFGALGLLLETLHAFKVGFYLDVSNDTRRLMWTLAHAHGTLIGLMHLGFAGTIATGRVDARSGRRAGMALTAATVLLPGGFFLGGIRFYAGDPGIGIVLVPVGAVLLIYAAVLAARGR